MRNYAKYIISSFIRKICSKIKANYYVSHKIQLYCITFSELHHKSIKKKTAEVLTGIYF